MSRKLLVGTVLLSAGILVAVFGLSSPKPVYARSVSEFVAQPSYDQFARVYGTLVPGTLCRRDDPCEYRFRLADQRSQLAVSYPHCLVPDTFRVQPGIDLQMTVEGTLCANCHQFEASVMFVKEPRKYEFKRMDGAVEATNARYPAMPVCPDP